MKIVKKGSLIVLGLGAAIVGFGSISTVSSWLGFFLVPIGVGLFIAGVRGKK